MSRYEDASRIAERLGLSPPRRYKACYYNNNNPDLIYYHSLIASTANAMVLQSCNEVLLNPEERARASQMRGDRQAPRPSTTVILIHDKAQVSWKAEVEDDFYNVFMSDGWGQQETWALYQELTVRIVSSASHTEVTVTAGMEDIARILHDQTCVLLGCMGRVGLALELLTALPLQSYNIKSIKSNPEALVRASRQDIGLHVEVFINARIVLSEMVGAAAMSNLISYGAGAVIPLGASHWLPRRMLHSLVNNRQLFPCQEGFVDMRNLHLESYVRLVRSADMKLLCPACWITPNSPKRREVQDQGITEPLRLVPPAGEAKEYTAVSYLWSEFRGTDSLQDMRRSAAAVGGPESLWIDRVCINQDDPLEKNSEIPRMGSYYAGAHTTLICPARKIVDIPRAQLSRHLVAVPIELRRYQGLQTWKQDDWHNRVWTYQEGALSRNPRVFAAEMNTGLSGSWLNFMAWAAECAKPIECDVGLPPYCWRAPNLPWGAWVEEEERWSYRHAFVRSWTACERHNWAPNVDSIKVPLARLIERTQLKKCAEPRDKILGLLGLTASSGYFNTNVAKELKDVFCEAIRCGILGAEVLLIGREIPGPRSWIPRIDSIVRSGSSQIAEIEYVCNAMQPVVDDNGSLILQAYQIKISKKGFGNSPIDDEIVEYFSEIKNLSEDEEGYIRTVPPIDTLGKAYLLVGNGDDPGRQLKNRILVFATEVTEGKHILETAYSIQIGGSFLRRNGDVILNWDRAIDFGDVVHLSLSME